MTLVAAMVGEGGRGHGAWVAMLSDRCANIGGEELHTLATPKLWRRGCLLVGGSGELRPLALVRRLVTLVPAEPAACGEEFGLAWAAEARRVLAKHEALSTRESTEQKESRCGFLLASPGAPLIGVDWDFSVVRYAEPGAAIGSGGAYARTLLYTPALAKHSARERLQLAGGAAAHFNASVRGPFDYAELHEDGTWVEAPGDVGAELALPGARVWQPPGAPPERKPRAPRAAREA